MAFCEVISVACIAINALKLNATVLLLKYSIYFCTAILILVLFISEIEGIALDSALGVVVLF